MRSSSPRLAGLMDLEVGDDDRERRDRDVEHEDPAPAQLAERAADQRADGIAEPGDAEDQRAREARPRCRESGEGHAEDRRPHHRAADRHPDTATDQRLDVRRRSAERGERGEQGGADEEHAAATEHVGEPPAGDDRHPEHQRIGVDHPLGGVDVGVEVLLDRGDRDVQRGEVVRDHQHAEPHRDERHHRPRRQAVVGRSPRGGALSVRHRGGLYLRVAGAQRPPTKRSAVPRTSSSRPPARRTGADRWCRSRPHRAPAARACDRGRRRSTRTPRRRPRPLSRRGPA